MPCKKHDRPVVLLECRRRQIHHIRAGFGREVEADFIDAIKAGFPFGQTQVIGEVFGVSVGVYIIDRARRRGLRRSRGVWQ